MLVVVAVLFVAGAAAGRLPDRERALALGFASGTGFGVVEVAVRLLEVVNPTQRAFYINPALYAVAAGGGAGFLLLTSALQRGSVTTTVAAMVVGRRDPVTVPASVRRADPVAHRRRPARVSGVAFSGG